MILKLLLKQNSLIKIKIVSDYFGDKSEKILDFGCGDLIFAKELNEQCKKLKITGIDVVDFGNRFKKISFKMYDGKKIPFPNNHFDTVISYHVLHHTKDPEKYLKEMARVSKKRIILIDSIARNRLDPYGMRLMDWLYNAWKPEPVPLTYKFLFLKKWHKIFKENNLKLKSYVDAEIIPIPQFFPIGRAKLFELYK